MIKNIYNKIIKMNFEKTTFKNYLIVKTIFKKYLVVMFLEISFFKILKNRFENNLFNIIFSF